MCRGCGVPGGVMCKEECYLERSVFVECDHPHLPFTYSLSHLVFSSRGAPVSLTPHSPALISPAVRELFLNFPENSGLL